MSDGFLPCLRQIDASVYEFKIKDMLDTELEFLGIDRMDVYWIHNPVDSPAVAEYIAEKTGANPLELKVRKKEIIR